MIRDFSKPIAATVGAALTIGTIGLAISADRHERDLILSGHCRAVTEVLYTPPPTARTSCYGENPPTCSTYFYQADPYFRTLWRCKDPERDGKPVEFWRRSRDDEAAQ